MSVVSIASGSFRGVSVGEGARDGARRSEAATAVQGSGASPTRLRLTARGRRVFGTLAALPVIFALIAFGFWGTAAAAGDTSPGQLQYVTVYSGDTLWQIAAERTPEGGDVRDTVAEIMSLNGLDSSVLTPGQQIAVLPAD